MRHQPYSLQYPSVPACDPLEHVVLQHVYGELLRQLAEPVVIGRVHAGRAPPPRRHALVVVAVDAAPRHAVPVLTKNVSAKKEGLRECRAGIFRRCFIPKVLCRSPNYYIQLVTYSFVCVKYVHISET